MRRILIAGAGCTPGTNSVRSLKLVPGLGTDFFPASLPQQTSIAKEIL